ncbi:hypothetical protein LCGC14_2846390 [marine sediment metagenome]|uniref:Uncharacterized protein n=1 Tax=marine sediment metagenome TaxID=412755 RepID=A0A0F9AI20_9ZZZZ
MTGEYRFKNCRRAEEDCIAGDQLLIVCMKPKDWQLDRITKSHRGKYCIARKNAKAKVLRSYTNVK